MQVDTLRLAIGYISFLAELVSNDRHPSDVLQNTVPEPPKKIFISSTKGNQVTIIQAPFKISRELLYETST